MSVNKTQPRHCMLYEFYQKMPHKLKKAFFQEFGEDSLGELNYDDKFAGFKKRGNNLKDKKRSGRPAESNYYLLDQTVDKKRYKLYI